jgi:hypothetical protein
MKKKIETNNIKKPNFSKLYSNIQKEIKLSFYEKEEVDKLFNVKKFIF